MASYMRMSRTVPIGLLVSNRDEVEVRLAPGEVFTLRGDRRGVRIVCTSGRLWVTQAGDPADHALWQGERFRVSKPGTVVIQGIPHGEARLLDSPRDAQTN